MVGPVTDGARRVGYIAREYGIAGGKSADATIEALAGRDVTAYYRNNDGSLWATLGGEIAPPPTSRDSSADGIRVTRPRVGVLRKCGNIRWGRRRRRTQQNFHYILPALHGRRPNRSRGQR